jgi:hypothetical protein
MEEEKALRRVDKGGGRRK